MSRRAWTKHLTRADDRRLRRRARAMSRRVTEISGVPACQTLPVTPVPKPRQTQRDRWAKRPCVLRYRAFCDELRMRQAQLPARYALIFVMPMPRSWPSSKRAAMAGRPHEQKPDLTNLEKSVEDALMANDERLFNNRGIKIWGDHGRLVILNRCDANAEESDATLVARALGETEAVTGESP